MFPTAEAMGHPRRKAGGAGRQRQGCLDISNLLRAFAKLTVLASMLIDRQVAVRNRQAQDAEGRAVYGPGLALPVPVLFL